MHKEYEEEQKRKVVSVVKWKKGEKGVKARRDGDSDVDNRDAERHEKMNSRKRKRRKEIQGQQTELGRARGRRRRKRLIKQLAHRFTHQLVCLFLSEDSASGFLI